MAYRGEHGVREVEAELWARRSGRRRAGVAGRANFGEARAVAELPAHAEAAAAAVGARTRQRKGGDGGVRERGRARVDKTVRAWRRRRRMAATRRRDSAAGTWRCSTGAGACAHGREHGQVRGRARLASLARLEAERRPN